MPGPLKLCRTLLAAALVGVASLGAAQAQSTNLEFVAGSPGGAWFTQVTGLSAIIMESNPDISVRVVPGGGRDNPTRIEKGLSQIGMGIDLLAKAAADGIEPYGEKHGKLRSMGASGVQVQFMVYVAADETRTLAEMLADPKGTFGVTPQSTSEHLTFLRALDFYGNSPEKIREAGGKFVVASYSELIQGFNDGQFDLFWSAGEIPSGIAAQVADGRRKAKLLAFQPELMKELSEKYGYGAGTLPAGTFGTLQSEDLPVTMMGNMYLASADVPDEVVYKVLKSIIDNRDKLGNIYKALGNYDPAVAWQMQPVPLHPGAERAFREAGFMK